MPAQGRDQLKKYFRNGNLAREEYFIDLIDSSVNKVSDQITVSDQGGLNVIASVTGRKFLSLFKSKANEQQQKPPSFTVQYQEDKSNNESLLFSTPLANGASQSLFTIKKESTATGIAGKIGVNTAQPRTELDVNGAVAMKSRVGTFNDATVNYAAIKADGKWYKLVSRLKGPSAFEVIAAVNSKSNGYAMHYTVAMNIPGRKARIKPIQEVYNCWWRRLQLRWTKENDGSYSLDIRTAWRYKDTPQIQVRMTRLWN
jgi:hypothetical protein